MHKLGLALQWRLDIEDEEFISAPNYYKTHLSFAENTSQQELSAICYALNLYFEKMESSLRIGNNMGELIPDYAVV